MGDDLTQTDELSDVDFTFLRSSPIAGPEDQPASPLVLPKDAPQTRGKIFMKRFTRTRRYLTLISSMTAITVVGVGISFAAAGWLSSGDGNATANGAASAPVPVVAALSSGTALTPGASTAVTIN